MPVYYDNNAQGQQQQAGANFQQWQDRNHRLNTDTDTSSGNRINDLRRRNPQANPDEQTQNRQQQMRDHQQRHANQNNNVFDRINRQNQHAFQNNQTQQGNNMFGQQNPRREQMVSLTQHMENLQLDLAAHPIQPERLSMLPQQQQQVKNLKDNLSVAHADLEARKININLFERINEVLNLNLDDDLQRSKILHMQQVRKLEEEKLRLLKADNLASKFTAALEMPTIVQPPEGFRRESNLLDKKNMVRMITPYDDTSLNSTRTFKLVWTEILNFGRGEYLNEDEYKTILSMILRGNIAEDFRLMDKEGKSLKEMVDELCVLYDTTQTLDDFQKEVDDFKREKNENLKKSMARANKLIRRLEPLSTEAAWPETYHNMRKSILRQVVSTTTRTHIDMEESRLIKAGATYDVDSLIKMAHEYESYNNAIPTKDIQTMYQVASMAPRRSPTDISKTEDQLKHLKTEMYQNKGLEAKLDEFIQIAANAAYQRDRATSLDSKSRAQFKHTAVRMPTSAPPKTQKDGDQIMKNLIDLGQPSSNYRADKTGQQTQTQQDRGRSAERNAYPQNRNRSQSQNRDRSQSQGRSQSSSSQGRQYPSSGNRSYPNRPQSQDRSQNWQQKQSSQPPERKIIWREPKLYVEGNKHYYDCAACHTAHTAEVVCEKLISLLNPGN